VIGFEINDQFYELPLLGTFDMDENRIFKQQTGLNAEDAWLGLQEGGDLSFHDLFRTDGFLEAMIHIAYRREHPDEPAEEIATMIGKLNRMEMFGSFVASLTDEDEEEAPLQTNGSTSEPDRSSPSEKPSKPSTSENRLSSSGRTSERSSGRPDDGPAPIGITGSGGPSTSARKALAG